CKSMDIRNNISELDKLENCTVIEGFLLITLITDADKLNRTYPLLTEVTGYIVVYRVSNLASLSLIFPNLSVIRGNILFESYALVVYQNHDLSDVGLYNLRAIVKGGVRIEKNSFLCFTKTVDWLKILSPNATESDVVMKLNRNEEECARCPGDNFGDDGQDAGQSDSGAVAPCKQYPGNKRYCWSNRVCQTICPKECPNNCIDEHTCCNESCLGSCTRPVQGISHCVACRNVSSGDGKCIDNCQEGYYQYEQRCITAKMCEQIGTKYESNKEIQLLHYNGKCTTRCEKGYFAENNTCHKCVGQCQHECEGGIIDSAERIKEFHGCTIIGKKEGLIINIKRGGQHTNEALVFGLGMVHTINTFLKVHLTYGVTTLDFFKSLRLIRGNVKVDDRYSLYVLENRDLEAIWAENQTVLIETGSIFFHFNPKLCFETIEKLKPMLPDKPTKFNKNEVAEDSNGDKGICNTRWLSVNVTSIGTVYVSFVINKTIVDFNDERSFIGYQMYQTVDPYGNVTKDNYQPCMDNWSVSEPSKSNIIFMTALNPYTNYAFYARTMTISSEKRNYQSDIIRVRTKASRPSPVTQITARSTDSSKMLLNWKPPVLANGKLIKYLVRAELSSRDAQLEPYRNYCRDPLPNAQLVDEASSPGEKTVKEVPQGNDCKCDAGGRPIYDQQNAERKIFDEIEFENALQNFLYVPKKTNDSASNNTDAGSGAAASSNSLQTRRRRFIEIEEEEQMESVLMRHVRSVAPKAPRVEEKKNESNLMDNWLNKTYMEPNSTHYKVYSAEVNASTTQFEFKLLRHFSLYTFTVHACREKENVNDTAYCSLAEPFEKRTQKKLGVDKAIHLEAALDNTLNTTRGNVRLTWEPPESPNGAIISYLIEYERQEQDAVEEKRCITVQDYGNQSGYTVTNLKEGQYSFRVRVNSLAGEGNFTDPKYVLVPDKPLSPFIILSWVVVLLVILVVAFWVYNKNRKKHPQELIMNTEVNPWYASLQYTPDEWEVPRERIIQLGPLGQGSFGMVYEGILKDQTTGEDVLCAIKTVNENATDRERTNFLSEASVMKQFNTYHVVHLLGVCSVGQPALVIMELMKKGDLKSYLRAHRPDEREVLSVFQQRIGITSNPQPPPNSRIFQMAIEIADGMAYLAAKKFVHRDLAARNCMVSDDLTVKIGDFGMTRDIYETDYYRKGTKGLLPVRWMPPESLRDGVYASSSDVFSYGVVLWEMATLASQPYQGLSNEQVLRFVIDGGIMERPENCPEVLHRLMHRCWHHRPTARPSFLDIIAYLEHLAEPRFKEVAFYYSDAGVQYREKERKEHTNQLEIFAGGPLDADVDAEDATTPLRMGEFQRNTSLDQPQESPIALVDDQATTHSPFSMHSGFIVSSTPDALSTLPTAGGSHMEDAAYVLPDAGDGHAEPGYEVYDPSPNFAELPHSGSGGGGGRLSGEQHLLPKKKRGMVPSMSSSMPDEMTGGSIGVAAGATDRSTAALQPTSGSSNTGSSRHPSLKRTVADMRTRVSHSLLNRFNHKRSGSNVSHKSNVSNAPSSSSNTNLTSQPAGMAMVSMGPNLGTIESGGSGSAGSYAGTPHFYTPTATTPSGGGNGSTTIVSDNPNYKLLDESTNSADPVGSGWPQQLAPSSLNPNYELMQPQVGILSSDNPNYVMMSDPTMTSRQPAQVFTSDNPNYAAMAAPLAGLSSDENELDDDEDDDTDNDEHAEHIKMERMPLSRQKPRARVKLLQQQQQQQPRSRSVSQTRKAETPTQTAPAALATSGNTSNILKENWLRQASTPRQPPPNGFIGREA
ncbi:hypothetical protein KR222_006357, partial [Zaprionus bogoriensis]